MTDTTNTLPPLPEAIREALHAARGFIRNGIALGYIRMPDPDTPDPAHETLPKIESAIAALAQSAQAPEPEDSRLLDFVAAEYLTLEPFDRPTGGDDTDVGWRTIQHHMGKPATRVASEVYTDDPRQAIREAMERLERDPYCTGPLHSEPAPAQPAPSVEAVERVMGLVRDLIDTITSGSTVSARYEAIKSVRAAVEALARGAR